MDHHMDHRPWCGKTDFGETTVLEKPILKKSVLENRFWKIDFGKTYFARFSHNRMRIQVISHTARSASRDEGHIVQFSEHSTEMTQTHRAIQHNLLLKANDWLIVGQWLDNGWQMFGQWLANGRPRAGQWLANGRQHLY